MGRQQAGGVVLGQDEARFRAGETARKDGDDVRVWQGGSHHIRRIASEVSDEARYRCEDALGLQVDDAHSGAGRRRVRAFILRHDHIDGCSARREAARSSPSGEM